MGLQLHSLRDEVRKDLSGTLKRVANMGFEGVEFASLFDYRAPEIRAALENTSLAVAGSNASIGSLVGDQFESTLRFHQMIGSDCVIVSSGLAPAYNTDEGNRIAAALFNEFAAKVEPYGVRVGFHAHMTDFADISGETAWDRFFSRTRKDVVMQVDVGNFFSGGADPYATIAKFPGRTYSIHLKSFPRGVIFGSANDTVDWPRVFRLCETAGKTRWYLIELVSFEGLKPYQAVENCLKNFRSLHDKNTK